MFKDLDLGREVRKQLIGTLRMRRCCNGFIKRKKVVLQSDPLMKESQVKEVVMKKVTTMKKKARMKKTARNLLWT